MNQEFKILASIIWIVLSFTTLITAQPGQETIETLIKNPLDTIINNNTSFSGYPYVFSTPEVGFAGGIGGILVFYTSKKPETIPSKMGISAYYSSTGQYKASLNPELYFMGNQYSLKSPVSFGHIVDKFWGIGNQTIETGLENYTRNNFTAAISIQVPPLWFAADRTGLIIEYDYTQIEDKKENANLLDENTLGRNGGHILGYGGDLVWDSRDNIFYPNSGNYQYLKIIVYPEPGDHVFAFIELDVRQYHGFGDNRVLAGNFYLAGASPGTPFYKLPSLGGQHRMRGYFEGRYRDRVILNMQMEYRQYFWRRFGFVVFAGIGDVASELTQFNFNNLKYSLGGGLRLLFNKEQKVNLRMDIGFGKDGNRGVYFGIEEAF